MDKIRWSRHINFKIYDVLIVKIIEMKAYSTKVL